MGKSLKQGQKRERDRSVTCHTRECVPSHAFSFVDCWVKKQDDPFPTRTATFVLFFPCILVTSLWIYQLQLPNHCYFLINLEPDLDGPALQHHGEHREHMILGVGKDLCGAVFQLPLSLFRYPLYGAWYPPQQPAGCWTKSCFKGSAVEDVVLDLPDFISFWLIALIPFWGTTQKPSVTSVIIIFGFLGSSLSLCPQQSRCLGENEKPFCKTIKQNCWQNPSIWAKLTCWTMAQQITFKHVPVPLDIWPLHCPDQEETALQSNYRRFLDCIIIISKMCIIC